MFVYMQTYIEIALVAILVVILFNGSTSQIKELTNSVLGKAILVVLCIVIAQQFGTNAGLLMAAIVVVLLNGNIEGMDADEINANQIQLPEHLIDSPSSEKNKKEEGFSNITLDNASEYKNLGSTLVAHSTNANIMSSMRASEYAKTAPGGCALMTNHIDTMKVVNNPSSQGIF